jgi:hypothetical protein
MMTRPKTLSASPRLRWCSHWSKTAIPFAWIAGAIGTAVGLASSTLSTMYLIASGQTISSAAPRTARKNNPSSP